MYYLYRAVVPVVVVDEEDVVKTRQREVKVFPEENMESIGSIEGSVKSIENLWSVNMESIESIE